VCLEQVARLFKVCCELMCLGNDVALIGGAALALKVVVLECLIEVPEGAAEAHRTALQTALDSMERCLRFQHKATWKYVLHVLHAVYQVIYLLIWVYKKIPSLL
jgi:hypothetical protein